MSYCLRLLIAAAMNSGSTLFVESSFLFSKFDFCVRQLYIY